MIHTYHVCGHGSPRERCVFCTPDFKCAYMVAGRRWDPVERRVSRDPWPCKQQCPACRKRWPHPAPGAE